MPDDTGDPLFAFPACPTCGLYDEVESSVSPEKWDGFCYRCKAPFKAVHVVKSDPLPGFEFVEADILRQAHVDACRCGHYEAGVDGVCRWCHS